jgi:hypothetical protein
MKRSVPEWMKKPPKVVASAFVIKGDDGTYTAVCYGKGLVPMQAESGLDWLDAMKVAAHRTFGARRARRLKKTVR